MTELTHQVHKLNRRIQEMALNTDKLVAAVAALKTVDASAVAALDAIPQLITDAVTKALAAAGVDDTAAQAIVDQATADATQVTSDLQTAVTAGTPAAPTDPNAPASGS
jgi:cell division septum initiation protein DivIVA